MLKCHDFTCHACQHIWEDLIEPGQMPPCPLCQSADTYALLSVPKMSAKAVSVMNTINYIHKNKKYWVSEEQIEQVYDAPRRKAMIPNDFSKTEEKK